MTEKERLAELLSKMPLGMTCDEIAHVLRVNGVRMPPCKIGSTVYAVFQRIDPEHYGELFIEALIVKQTSINDFGVWCVLAGGKVFNEDQFGVDVFRTREDAETEIQRLKGERE